jgi:hypothetical protein
MCKEMPVIPVSKVVDPKRIIGKMEGRVVCTYVCTYNIEDGELPEKEVTLLS